MKIGYIRSLVSSTIFCIIAVAGILIGLVALEDSGSGDAIYRLLGVFAILDVLGTIVSPVLVKSLGHKKV